METDTVSASQSEIQAKLAQITSPTATMLQDMPMELLEHILIEAIVEEVRDRKLLRHGWKESANRVMERLKRVCRQWENVLSTDLFRNRLHRFIDNLSHVEICFKLTSGRKFSNCVTVVAMNDEVFVLGQRPHQQAHIETYACDDLKTMKRTIQLPCVTMPWDMAACDVSNQLYVLHQSSRDIAVLRVSMEGQHFQLSHFITCSTQLVSKVCVSGDGKLILYQGPLPSTISVYDVEGHLQHKMEFVKPISYLHSIMSKSNGNVVLVSKANLTEIDGEGNTVQEYKSYGRYLYGAADQYSRYLYGAADQYDRIVAIDEGGSVRLVDAEFNHANANMVLATQAPDMHFYRLTYNKKRNEFVAFETAAFCDRGDATQRVTIFNFTERSIPGDVRISRLK